VDTFAHGEGKSSDSDVSARLRAYALVSERAAGCTCRPQVDAATVVTPDGAMFAGVVVTHEDGCPRQDIGTVRVVQRGQG
jgi:hypothetical protein